MKYKLFFIAFFSSSAMALDLTSGVGITEEVKEALWDTSIPYAIARQGQRFLNENQSVIAFMEQPNFIFSLSSDNYLVQTARSDRKVLGSWQIGAPDQCEDSDNPDCVSPWWVGRWGADEVLEQEITDRYATGEMGWNQGLGTDDTIMGCMGRVPLRYGDIEGDGKKELAIFLLNGYSLDFVIFSPEKHKNIFTAKLDFNNVLKHEAIFLEDGSMNEMLPHKSLPYYQYWSRTGVDSGSNFSMSQGYRGFGKLYVGHFASTQSSDILVWRKAYKSHLLTDTVKGFEKISDTYIHYKLVDGEYKKQDTESSVAKGWLIAKNLTWQKGYPSKSECPGQEGQLIPEMHDPLLNDPDVLQ